MIIYQVLTRLWGEGKFSSFDDASFNYIKNLGVSHIWYTGVLRHATGEPFVKGNPGSPYAICDYYDVNTYLADNEDERMAEFESLVKRTHESGLKLIIDFVPNHVAPNYSDSRGGLETYDYHDADWTDTLKLNYGFGHNQNWDKLLDIIRFWASKGVDGFRCDMAELVPVEFFGWMIPEVKKDYPDVIFIAEAYSKDNYRTFIKSGKFDYLYDKSGLYDILSAIIYKNIENNGFAPELWQSARSITWNWQNLSDLQPKMLNFLENHDELRLASNQFAGTPQRGFASLYVSALFNTAPFMLYFGQEIGVNASESDNGRTSIFNFQEVDQLKRLYEFIHTGTGLNMDELVLMKRYFDVLNLAASPIISEGLVYDLCYCNVNSEGFDQDRHFAFLRDLGDETLLIVANFSCNDCQIRINIPQRAVEFLQIKEAIPQNGFLLNVSAYDAIVVKI